jgi:hypothetical protein
VVVRNYEGFISAYAQPTNYRSHDPATCAYCQARRSEGGQEGVAGLLAGQTPTITPEGWHILHQRGIPEWMSLPPLQAGEGRGGGELFSPPLLSTPAPVPKVEVER